MISLDTAGTLHRMLAIAPSLKNATIILFGSVARGDTRDESDIDIAIVSDDILRPFKTDFEKRINISVYTKKKILKMAVQKSIFVKHLIHEGVVIYGNNHFLKELNKQYVKGHPSKRFYKSLVFSLKFLDLDKKEYLESWQNYNRLILYLYRTFLYLKCDELSINLFSIPLIAKKLEDPQINELYNLKYDTQPNFEKFNSIKARLESMTQTKIINEFQTFDALLVNATRFGKLPEWLGIKLKTNDGDVFLYE